ncbi:hypothetical protein ABZP36_036000 [Zizania latifolia]
MTPLAPADDSIPTNHLLRLVAKGLAELGDATRGGGASAVFNSSTAVGYGGLMPPLGINAVDFSMQVVKSSSKSFPKHETRNVSDHKVLMIKVLLYMMCLRNSSFMPFPSTYLN